MPKTQYFWKKGEALINASFPLAITRLEKRGWANLGENHSQALEELKALSEEDWIASTPRVVEPKPKVESSVEPEVKSETEQIKRGRGRPRKYPVTSESGA